MARERRRPDDDDLGPDVGLESARPDLPAADVGAGLVRADLVGTGVFAVVSLGALVAPDAFLAPLAVLSLGLCAVGFVAFAWAYLIAVGRSRTDAIGMGGLYFLAGCAPQAVRVRMLAAFAAQVVLGIVVASVHPFTEAAFAVLTPLYGMGLAGLWAARHGAFPPRVVKRRGAGRPSADETRTE